jgi:uncharacterized protein (DUF2235 family)
MKKKLIICCDGTWNRADQEHNGVPSPTNVVKIANRIAKRHDAIPQIVYYGQGVGTGNMLDRYSGGALGEGLEDNIYDAYRFLILNYEPGDELFFFGFSRGAYTVRSLVGMIQRCGIIRRDAVDKYRNAIALYRKEGKFNDEESKKFRQDYSISGDKDIKVKFIGVWDTVGTLGIPLRGLRWVTRRKYQFHNTELSEFVDYAYHALAIDEHRAPFEPTLWSYKPKENQKVEQVWFCGTHSDVGGGRSERGLSDITLQWMIDKAHNSAELEFNQTAIGAFPLQPNIESAIYNSKRGLYRVTPGIHRTIGLGKRAKRNDPPQNDPTQSVHESVIERWDKDDTYRPSSLKDYFKRIGDPRGG